jgi:hypothetical protein
LVDLINEPRERTRVKLTPMPPLNLDSVAHAPVQRQGFGHVLAQGAGDAQEELLRGLDHLARVRVAQQIAVVQGAQAEVIEAPVQRRIQRVVQFARVGLHEAEQAVVDQSDFVAAQDRLRERMDFLPGHFLGDGVCQQTRGQAAVFGFFGGQQRGGADGKLVQLARGGAVVQARDGARRHAHRIDGMQAFAVALHRAHDLVEVHRFLVAVAFGHAHRGGGGRWSEQERIVLGRVAVRGVACRAEDGRVVLCQRCFSHRDARGGPSLAGNAGLVPLRMGKRRRRRRDEKSPA